ncbi:M15 family metallopeptidase [Micromonospora sp. CPCC 205371]|nr:M15 family metallopeptidase [Micromonospora sp. CPCC 205371]
MRWGISSAYQKSHTGWQHHAALTEGMIYREPARTAARRTRSIILAALVVVSAALIGIPVYRSLAPSSSSSPSSSSAVSPSDSRHDDHHGPPGEARPQAPRIDRALDRQTRSGVSVADGVVPDGVTVFDDEFPAVAKLDADLLGALRQAARDADDDGVEFFVNSGWRSPKYQEQLLREAISKYGSEKEAARWVSTPDTSAHVTGEAIDIGPSDATAWLSKHGADYGLCQIYRNEPWHYELRPEAINEGCPAMYADPTQDPRMQQ